MMQETNCLCRAPNGSLTHAPWKCPSGKHSVRLMPPLYSSSVIHWARNWTIAQALYGQPNDGRPPDDYFFLMDDDMLCQPSYLRRLMSYKLDIVCGICTVRKDPPRPNIRFWNPERNSFVDPIEWDWDSQKLIEIDAAGAAFMLVKRRVLERMGQAHLNCEFERDEDWRKTKNEDARGELREYWLEKSKLRREKFRRALEEKNWQGCDQWWFQFLTNVVDSQLGELGEDISFCWKAKKLGFKIYADPQVLPGHIGSYGYSISDYRDFVESAKKDGQMPEPRENKVALEA